MKINLSNRVKLIATGFLQNLQERRLTVDMLTTWWKVYPQKKYVFNLEGIYPYLLR